MGTERGQRGAMQQGGEGAYSLLHGEVGRILAFLGTRVGAVPPGPGRALDTPTFLGVFWQNPHVWL